LEPTHTAILKLPKIIGENAFSDVYFRRVIVATQSPPWLFYCFSAPLPLLSTSVWIYSFENDKLPLSRWVLIFKLILQSSSEVFLILNYVRVNDNNSSFSFYRSSFSIRASNYLRRVFLTCQIFSSIRCPNDEKEPFNGCLFTLPALPKFLSRSVEGSLGLFDQILIRL